jgi:hypothetical protein
MLFKQPKPKFDFDAEVSDLLDRARQHNVSSHRIIEVFEGCAIAEQRHAAINSPHASAITTKYVDGYGRPIVR